MLLPSLREWPLQLVTVAVIVAVTVAVAGAAAELCLSSTTDCSLHNTHVTITCIFLSEWKLTD